MPNGLTDELILDHNLTAQAFARRPGISDDLAKNVVDNLAALRAPATTFDSTASTVIADEMLSPEGKADGLLKAGTKTLAGIDAWEAEKASTLRDPIATLEAEVTPPASDDPIELSVRYGNVLARVAELDPNQRMAIYLDAAEPIQRAFEAAGPVLESLRPGALPVLRPLIDPETIAGVQERRAAAAHPDQWAELERLRALHRLYTSAANTARTALRRRVRGL